MHRAAGVHEAEAVAFQLLHDEAFAAEQTDADSPLERDADRDAARRAQERVLLTDQRAAQLLQIHRQDLARIGRGERDLLLAATAVGEDGHEQALTREQPLAGAENRAHHSAARRLAAIAEHGLHR